MRCREYAEGPFGPSLQWPYPAPRTCQGPGLEMVKVQITKSAGVFTLVTSALSRRIRAGRGNRTRRPSQLPHKILRLLSKRRAKADQHLHRMVLPPWF